MHELMPIQIFKASAGSGKTFRLVRFYLYLCFKHHHDPFYFTHILAITFTNKATREMKERILKDVKTLAENARQSDHLDYLLEVTGMSEEILISHARIIQKQIILHYDQLAVYTIDSFFQKVLRSFAREIGLDQSYKIQVKTYIVIEMAIDLLVKDLDATHPLFPWLDEQLQESISKGRHFDLRNLLQKIAKEVYSEEIEIGDPESLDKNFLYKLWENLKKSDEEVAENIVSLKNQLIQINEAKNLTPDDYSGKSRSFMNTLLSINEPSDLKKIITNKTIPKILEDPHKLYANSNKHNAPLYIEAYNNGLKEVIEDYYHFAYDAYQTYNTNKSIKENFVPLLTISYLTKYLRQCRQQENWMILAEANAFLHQLMDTMYVPFLYEKISVEYHHILIDEFQDTSALQWKNLSVLLEENVSRGYENLIVGDVKQAIYRFRNGKWNLLQSEVESQYPDVVNVEYLNTNYRSDGKIIEFNNFLFNPQQLPTLLKQALEEIIEKKDLLHLQYDRSFSEITDIYTSRSQLVSTLHETHKGLVRLHFLSQDVEEEEKEEAEQNYEEDILSRTIDPILYERIESILLDLFTRGYQPKDIVFLSRNKKQIIQIIDIINIIKAKATDEKFAAFLVYLNNDSLLLSNHKTIRYIIAHFQLMLHPENNLYQSEVFQLMYSSDYTFQNIDNLQSHAQEWKEVHARIVGTSLLEMTEFLLNIYPHDTDESDASYIQSFMEEIIMFQSEHGSSISEFLRWWKKECPKLEIPEDVEAMRLMTFHQSKGLEFPVVILSHVNWKFAPEYKHHKVIWVEHNVDEKNITLPIRWNYDGLNTDFCLSIFQEIKNSFIDHLNLLYVGCTRPEHELHVISTLPKVSKSDSINLDYMNCLLYTICQQNCEKFTLLETPTYTLYEMGQPTQCAPQVDKSSPPSDTLRIPTFRTHLPSLHMPAWEEDSISGKSKAKNTVLEGNKIHKILEFIRTPDDIEYAIKKCHQQGIISTEEIEKWKVHMHKLLSIPEISHFFQPSFTILNERAIISAQGQKYVPDRVLQKEEQIIIIDYKSGSKQEMHARQLKKYRKLYEDLGYSQISTYVLYTHLFTLIEID